MVAVTVPAARIFGSSLVPSRFHCSGEILPATLMIACATVMPSGWGHSGVAGVSGGVGSGPDGGTGVISVDLSFSASDLVSRSIIAEESLHLAGWEWRITSVLISTMAGTTMAEQQKAGSSNAAQIEFWNSAASRAWADQHERMDRAVAEVTKALLELAAPQPGEHVLDIGCGSGTTVLELAARVGPDGPRQRAQALALAQAPVRR